MHYGEIKNYDIANGKGIRVSLFVSGCRRYCKGCFNQEAWSFDYGEEYTVDTRSELLRMLDDDNVAGLSILGGDPFEPENQAEVLELCKEAKNVYPDKDIWVWTGLLWNDVKSLPVMKYIDILVDGPFVESQKNLSLPFCGSSNQRVIDVKRSLEKKRVIQLNYEGGV